MTSTWSLTELGWQIERTGLTGLDDAVRAVAGAALEHGVSPVLAAVLADVDAPEVARIRAFGLLALRLASGPRADLVRAA